MTEANRARRAPRARAGRTGKAGADATVRITRSGAVATITLARPDKLNALSPREHQALQRILAELRSDFTTRVVILTGAGRAFSAGADLSSVREEGKPQNDLERRHRARIGDRTVAAIDALDQVTIAAINGLCIGGGAVLALACDLRVMARDAWLSIPEVAIGMPLTWGALPLLLREIGPARTIELVATCERVGAADALAYGLVSHVVDDAVAKARAIADKIVAAARRTGGDDQDHRARAAQHARARRRQRRRRRPLLARDQARRAQGRRAAAQEGHGNAARCAMRRASGVMPRKRLGEHARTLLLLALAATLLAACATSHKGGGWRPWRTSAPTGPPQPGDLVDITTIDPTIMVDIRYASTRNFTGVAVYPVGRCLLRRDIAERLKHVQEGLAPRDLGLKVWDCYRPISVQQKFWKLVPDSRYVMQPVFRDGKPVDGSKHNRGAAVDLTLVDTQGNDVPMPTDYDDFSERANRSMLRGDGQAMRNSRMLEVAMVREGFEPLPTEWWHFDGPGWEKYELSDAPLE